MPSLRALKERNGVVRDWHVLKNEKKADIPCYLPVGMCSCDDSEPHVGSCACSDMMLGSHASGLDTGGGHRVAEEGGRDREASGWRS